MTTNKKTTGSRRHSKYKLKPVGHTEDVMNLTLDRLARELVDVKTKSGGRIPYGSITGIVQKMQHALPWLTKHMIQNRLKKLDAGQRGSQMLGSTSCRGITDGGAAAGTTHS